MPKVVKKKATPGRPVKILMCCSVGGVSLRFDQPTFQQCGVAVNPTGVEGGTKSRPTVDVTRKGGIVAHLRYIVNNTEYEAVVTQQPTVPGTMGEPLPMGIAKIIVDLSLPTASDKRDCLNLTARKSSKDV
jgi:hypothetical protein